MVAIVSNLELVTQLIIGLTSYAEASFGNNRSRGKQFGNLPSHWKF
jgi:hypothetical protein